MASLTKEGRPDLILFVGPVDQRLLDEVEFPYPTEVQTVHAPQDNSASYRQMGTRPLAELVPDVTGKTVDSFRNIAVSAFSKGGSFADQLLRQQDARQRVKALILNDAVFGGQHDGLRAYEEEAADGHRLMVITNSNNQASTSLSKRARESVEDLLGDDIGSAMTEIEPAPGMPQPSGGVWKLGDLYWYDYVQPSGVNDIAHGDHHNLADDTWAAHVVPYFEGTKINVFLVAAGLAVIAGAVVWLGRKS